MNEKIKYFLWVSLGILVAALLWYFKSIVFFLVVSVVLSLVMRPLFDFIKRIKIKSWHPSNALSALITLMLLWVFIIAFFWLNIPLILREVQFLSQVEADTILARIEGGMGSFLKPMYESDVLGAMVNALNEQVKSAVLALLDFTKIRDIISSFIDFIGGIFIFIFSVSFITFFFLKEEWLVIGGLLLFIPATYEEGLRHMLQTIKTLLRRYFLGVILQVSLITLLVTLGFYFVGIGFEHAIIIGLFAGFINVIPYLGPLIGSVFGLTVSLIVFFQAPYSLGFWPLISQVLIIFAFIQLLDNLIFQPLIFSSSVRAHPLEVFLVILMAGYMSGLVGMFLAIPAYTILRVIAREFFFNYKLVKKLTEKLS